jgi:hypothetical protein
MKSSACRETTPPSPTPWRSTSAKSPCASRTRSAACANLPRSPPSFHADCARAGPVSAFPDEAHRRAQRARVGVFMGYSSSWIALALPPGGKIVACDVSEEYTAIARNTWREAGVEDKIALRLAPALETLDGLIAAGPIRHVRHRLHRRRQVELLELLRARAPTGPPRRPDRRRQHPVGRQGDRPHGHRRRHRGDPRVQSQAAKPMRASP